MSDTPKLLTAEELRAIAKSREIAAAALPAIDVPTGTSHHNCIDRSLCVDMPRLLTDNAILRAFLLRLLVAVDVRPEVVEVDNLLLEPLVVEVRAALGEK